MSATRQRVVAPKLSQVSQVLAEDSSHNTATGYIIQLRVPGHVIWLVLSAKRDSTN